jgi:hypothetical protein
VTGCSRKNRTRPRDFTRFHASAYLLTPEGLGQKARLLARFIARQEAEDQTLEAERAALPAEAGADQVLPAEPEPPGPGAGGNSATVAHPSAKPAAPAPSDTGAATAHDPRLRAPGA